MNSLPNFSLPPLPKKDKSQLWSALAPAGEFHRWQNPDLVCEALYTVSYRMDEGAVEVGKCIFNCWKRKYDYVKKIKENFKKLNYEEKNLLAKYTDVQKQVERNKATKEKTASCGNWLDNVDKLKEDIIELKIDYWKNDYNSGTYLCGLCPFTRLLKLSKDILRTTEEVEKLKNDIAQIDIMVEKSSPPPVHFIRKHAPKLNDLPSLDSRVETLLEWLETRELKRICIWGPPGVGKTTIMENLHDRVGESGKFGMIFWVTVTAEGNTREEILDEIWNRLDREMDGRDVRDQRANMISNMLQDKKYVLFLDFNDISSNINLREVGIHDDHVYGKVVFACRCARDNLCGDTDEEMKVERLSDEDAANFFWKVVGSGRKRNLHIKDVSKQIINECGGMPRMIKLIGKSLGSKKDPDPAIWRSMLNKLRSPTMERREDLEEYYKAFKAIYENLVAYRPQCLLYWAVFPVGYEISRDHIIDCWRAEQFLPSQWELRKARDEGHAILEEFVDESLLEKGSKLRHFKMYEFFQRAALRIAKNKFNFCVTEDKNIRDEEWEQARRVSLIRVQQSNLPESPQCCGILSLLLQETSLTEFPRKFFGYMRDLQVLNLQETRIAALPSSISSLTNLKGLFLNKSGQLLQLPSEIGDLQSLEILDIHGLCSLPIEIGKLVKLKCLRVSFTEDVGNHNYVEEMEPMIPSNVIAKLSKLEELSIGVRQKSSGDKNIAEIANEISRLEELTTLCFFFPEIASFLTFIQNIKSLRENEASSARNRIRSFSIVVGGRQNNATEFSAFECSAENHLKFSAGSEFPVAFSQVLKQANAFELIDHRTATSLSVFGANNLQGLEACIIEKCSEMTTIIQRNGSNSGVEFENLKTLHLKNLPKLKQIWSGSIGSESLVNLTTLILKGCHSIRTLLSESMILPLSQLQELQVEDCSIMKDIIEDRSKVNSEAFPELKKLQLYDLPELCSISPVPLQWPSLETILIKTCMKITNLPQTVEKASRLKEIHCTEEWWNAQSWPNADIKDHLGKLGKFRCN